MHENSDVIFDELLSKSLIMIVVFFVLFVEKIDKFPHADLRGVACSTEQIFTDGQIRLIWLYVDVVGIEMAGLTDSYLNAYLYLPELKKLKACSMLAKLIPRLLTKYFEID